MIVRRRLYACEPHPIHSFRLSLCGIMIKRRMFSHRRQEEISCTVSTSRLNNSSDAIVEMEHKGDKGKGKGSEWVRGVGARRSGAPHSYHGDKGSTREDN